MLMTTAECLAKYGSFYRMAQSIRRGELHKLAHGVYSDGIRPVAVANGLGQIIDAIRAHAE